MASVKDPWVSIMMILIISVLLSFSVGFLCAYVWIRTMRHEEKKFLQELFRQVEYLQAEVEGQITHNESVIHRLETLQQQLQTQMNQPGAHSHWVN